MKRNKNPELFVVIQISSIQQMLLDSVSRYSDKLAMEDFIQYPISKVTYSELMDYVLKFGSSLQKLGLKQKDHIAVVGENRVQWAITFLTAMVFDYTIIPVDKNLPNNEIINIIHDSDAEAVVFSGNFSELFNYKNDVLNKVRFYINMDLMKTHGSILSMSELIQNINTQKTELPEINSDDTAEIVYTSGSLGRAKGVMLTQKNLSSNLMAMRKMIKIYPSDRFLAVLPMHHTYQCTCGFLCPLYSGASIHFARSLKTVAEDMIKCSPSILLSAPLMYNKMYAKIIKSINSGKIKSLLFSGMRTFSELTEKIGIKNSKEIIFKKFYKSLGGSIRLLIAGGAAPDPKVSKFFRSLGLNFIQGYGLTETSPILTLNRIDYFKDESAGLPLDGVEIKIDKADKDGVGEIFARGSNIMKGYYNNTLATAETFEGNWFKTGDLGYFDNEGFLYICGRKKNVIIANNGENVYPEEIEDILNRSNFVLECMVFGEEDEKHDERIAALIVPDASVFIEYSSKNNVPINPELIDDLIGKAVQATNSQLAKFKQIKKYYISERELEKTTTQKIKRHSINKLLPVK